METESMKTMTRICRWLAVALLWAVSPICFAQVAETVTYYYTDQQGSPLVTSDASGTVISTSDYRPYGSQVLGSPAVGPGYTGHVNDPDSGLAYMQARYYDPIIGRFISADLSSGKPGEIFKFNRYSYADANPTNNRDPDGRDCTTNDGTTHCVTAVYDVSFRAQPGFQDFTSSSLNYHFYSTPVISLDTSVPSARWQLNRLPTPGWPDAATPNGTPNDATPLIGGLSPWAISPVMSFAVVNMKDGQPAVVNVTEIGHRLASGIVVREVIPMPGFPDGSVTQSWGEGTSSLQTPSSRLSDIINGIWNVEGPIISDRPHCHSAEDSGCW